MQTSPTPLWAFVVVIHMGSQILTAQSPQPPRDPPPRSTRIAATDRFAFHSDPWINLHHFLYQSLTNAFEAADAKPPANLWHAIIFATAGEFVRSIAASEGHADYTAYWIREGFENLDGWKELVRPVSEYWLPVVRGEVSRVEGLNALARALNGR